MTSRAFFQDVADALAGFLPPDLRGFSSQVTSRMVKVWYGEWRDHYEVQLVGSHTLPARLRKAGPVLEIGFHSEHPDPEESSRVIRSLPEPRWRRALGPDAEVGPCFGSDRWARLSEVWQGDGTDAPEAAVDAAERLAAYIKTIEPLRAPARR